MNINMKKRWEKIMKILVPGKFTSINYIIEKMDSSPATVRRDLKEMEKLDLVTLARGGVILNHSDTRNFFSGTTNLLNEKKRLEKKDFYYYEINEYFQIEKEKKMAIAKKAAEQIGDGESVFIGTGTTTYYMIDYIKAKNIKVMTDGFYEMKKLIERGFSIHVLEGFLHEMNGSIILTETSLEKLSKIRFDCGFIGTRGVSKAGYTTTNARDGVAKKLQVSILDRPYILCDSSKFSISNLVKFADLDKAVLISDQPYELIEKEHFILAEM